MSKQKLNEKIKEYKAYYKSKIEKLDFFSKKPFNAMVHRFLINKMLYKIYDYGPQQPKELIDTVYAKNFEHKKPEWLINETSFPFARFFHLAKKDNQSRIILTKLGRKYIESDKSRPEDISELQAKAIRDWIINNPFQSKVINGINNFIEVILEILRNSDPIPEDLLIDYFTLKSGKYFDWKEENTKKTQFSDYRNFCEELRLIDIIDDKIYITPIGYKFIIQLQINRVREMINLI